MSDKLKIFPEKGYKEILQEVGKFRYAIYDKGETVPGDVFRRTLAIEQYNCVVAGTGSTVSLCALSLPENKQVVIPQNSPVVVVRLLRKDDKHGVVHYNADDQIIFPTEEGNIFRLARKDAPDHYLAIAAVSYTMPVADAFKLPLDKSGPIDKYSARGAKLHLNLSHDIKNNK
jgi:hypothetical protein